MDGREVNIGELNIDWGFPIGIEATDVKIANADWAKHEQMISVAKLDVTLKVAPLFKGEVSLGKVDLQGPQVHLARREDGTSNWAALTGEDDKSGKPPLQPDIIRIQNGEFTYRDEALEANISVTVETEKTAAERRLQVTGDGSFQGKPFKLNAEGGAPSEALEKGTRYPVSIEASLGDMQVSFEGQSLNIYKLETLHGDLRFAAPDQAQLGKLSSLFDQPGLTLPPLEVQAELSHKNQRWALKSIQASAGSSQLSGSVAVQMTETPRIDIDLDSERLNLNEFGIAQMLSNQRNPADGEHGTEAGAEADIEPAGIEQPANENQQEQQDIEQASWDARLADILAPLRQYEGTADVQVDELILGEARLDQLELKASLKAGRLQIDQLNAARDSGALDAKGWIEAQKNTFRADLTANLDQLDLGQTLQPFGLEQLGIVDGRLHGSFDGDALRISDTRLSYDKLEQELHVQAQIISRDLPDTEAPGLHVEGQGTRYDESFRLNLTMGPLLDLKAEDQPYPVEGRLVSGETEATIDGSITQPLELKGFDIQFNIAGPNPAHLNAVTALSLPDLPQYEASGRIRLENELVRVTDLHASIGESDLSGDIRVARIRVDLSGKTMVWATLHSDQLNLNDLQAVASAADTSDEQNSSKEEPSDEQVFDHKPLDLQMLNQLDAEIRYRAGNIIAKDIPLSNVVLDASLDQGILHIEPLRVGLGGGDVTVKGKLDVREPALQGNLDLSMKQVNLRPLLKSANLPEVAEDSAGVLQGQGNLSFEGGSIAELMAGLDGTVELAMSDGYLDVLVIELLGFDAGEALIAAVSDVQQVPLRCTYIKAVAESGLVTMEHFYINTADTSITGGGTINLETEQLDLVLEPHAKDFSLLSVDKPLELNGSLAKPEVDVFDGGLIARGVASALGALVAPPLALLPWIEPGTGENVGPGCQQALQEYRERSK